MQTPLFVSRLCGKTYRSRDRVLFYIYNLLHGGTSSGATDYCLNPSVEVCYTKSQGQEWADSSTIVTWSEYWPEHFQRHS